MNEKEIMAKKNITLVEFIDTGKITPVDVFNKKHPEFKIHNDCTDVVVYMDKIYIQMLKSGSYFFEYKVNKKKKVEIELITLDIVEVLAWENFISNKY